MALIPIFIFTLVGLATALAAKTFMPRVVPKRTYTLALLGVMGSLAAGMMSLILFGHGRAHDYIYDHAHAEAVPLGETLPGHWMSLLIAPAGVLIVLVAHKLIRSRLMAR